jgi:glycosyltransferase involved in cell wall biosynthesis
VKFVLINYRYFVSGGPERYMFNLKDLLESKGHEVVPFSIAYEKNEPTEYARYFASPLSSSDEVFFRDQTPNAASYAKTLERSFYSREVYRKLARLIDDVRPDAAIVLHFLRKLSPAVLKCLADKDVPFAVRLSDFALVCPNAHLLRDSKPCELCVGGSLRHSVRYGCVQGSRLVSGVNYLATRFHQAAGYYDLIQKLMVPSRFTQGKFEEAGWARERLAQIPTFVRSPARVRMPAPKGRPTVAYVGRLAEIKGVETLVEAVALLHADPGAPEFDVRIVGAGDAGYRARLVDRVARERLPVAFDGELNREQVADVLASARCAVVPSLCYENLPNAALEAMVEATPVACSDHGSFPEIVDHGTTGLLSPPGDARALALSLKKLLGDAALAAAMGRAAADYVNREHGAERHYERVIETMDQLRSRAITAPRN